MHREYCSSQLLWSSNIGRNAGGWIKPFLVSADANVFNCLLSRKEPAAHWIGETPLFSRMLQIVTVLGNQAATQHTPSPQADHRELKQILWHNALFAFVAYSVCAHGSDRQFMITLDVSIQLYATMLPLLRHPRGSPVGTGSAAYPAQFGDIRGV